MKKHAVLLAFALSACTSTATTPTVQPSHAPAESLTKQSVRPFITCSATGNANYTSTVAAVYSWGFETHDSVHGYVDVCWTGSPAVAVNDNVTVVGHGSTGTSITATSVTINNATPTPSPTPTPSETVLWQAGGPGPDIWEDANTAQCGSPVQSGTQFTMQLVKNGTSCGRNQVQPENVAGSGDFPLTMGTQYTWTFHYIDGTPSDGAPGMGPDTNADSLIFQIHGAAAGGCGSPTVNLGFMNNASGVQEWYFEIVQFDGNPLWTGSYTPQESDDWKIVVKVAESGGTTALYRNGSLVYSGSNQATACSTVTWWNFGPYKWRWELAGGGGSDMSTINATIQNMELTTP